MHTPLKGSDFIIHTQALFDMPAPDDTPKKKRRRWKPKVHKKRVDIAYERTLRVAIAAVPQGSVRSASGSEWIRDTLDCDEFHAMRPQKRRGMAKLIPLIPRSLERSSMTVMPGIDYLAQTAGIGKRSVERYMSDLHAWGRLGTVARGRTAAWSPNGTNERAVYVLTKPAPFFVVDKTGGPTAPAELVDPTGARARNKTPKATAAPRLPYQATSGRSDLHPANRRQEFWPGDATTSAKTKGARRAAEAQASRELRSRSFPLRQGSIAEVATACREWFMAGWTVNDILYPIDHKPRGGQWPHDGADGVADIGRWLKYRLGAWKRDGTVIRSKTQRIVAEQHRHKALQRKALADRADRLANLAGQAETNRVGAAVARAVVRGHAKINNETGEVVWIGQVEG